MSWRRGSGNTFLGTTELATQTYDANTSAPDGTIKDLNGGTLGAMLAVQVVGSMGSSANVACFGDISVDLVLREE